jgi:hypothetical protein
MRGGIEMMRYQDIPEEIRDFVRDNHCNECRGGRARCEESNERECDSFFEEAKRLMEEDNLPFHYDECEVEYA